MKSITPNSLRRALRDGCEHALLDVRERGAYAASHLFTAINLPLSRLELRMRRYVPRPDTRVLLCDAGDRFAERAAVVMEAAGYTDVSLVEGGVRNCTAAGFQMFKGHYALPYAFGLHVDRRYRPDAVTPENLADSLGSDRAPVVIDTRRRDEYSEGTVPGAVNVPLGELTYRIRDVVPDAATPVVVTCGAVTRGILGAVSLNEAGIANPVAVLTNGLRGWEHAGFTSEPGTGWIEPGVSTAGAAFARGAVERVAAAIGVRQISRETFERWRSDTHRTLYVVDVRTREEYESGHLADSIWIPGGELIGLYEDHIGTMNARVCLVDSEGVRAAFVAGWLNRMGWPDVAVLEGGTDGWRAGGLKLVSGLTRTLGEIDDLASEFTARDGDDHETIRSARRRMLEWQAELLDVLDRDSTFAFPDLGKYPEPRRPP